VDIGLGLVRMSKLMTVSMSSTWMPRAATSVATSTMLMAGILRSSLLFDLRGAEIRDGTHGVVGSAA
jgi:hypothetical protein